MTDISAILVAQGNPPHLFESLASVEFCKERIVLDIGLAPDTRAQLQKLPRLTVIPVAQTITYIEQIHERSKEYAHCNIILFLDPDEIIPLKLAQIIQRECVTYDAIAIPRKNFICHKWIRHSRWWPDYQIRVFKKDKAFWPIKLHAKPEVTGSVHTLPEDESIALIHHNYESLDEYFTKLIRYAKTEARERFDEKQTYALHTCISEALQEFMSRYFAADGYRDGMHGLMLAFLQMMYKLIVYFYFWEISGYPETKEDLPRAADAFFTKGYEESSHWMITKKFCSPVQTLKRKLMRVLTQ